MSLTQDTYINNPEKVAKYIDGVLKFVPGYQSVHTMAIQLISEKVTDAAKILVVGAGGGLELKAFASIKHKWRFMGVDPSSEMINLAKITCDGLLDRIQFHQGTIEDAPKELYDAATCLLVLHSIPDNGEKLHTLKEIRNRLKPGAPFIIVNLSLDKKSSDAETMYNRYTQYSILSGADIDYATKCKWELKNEMKSVSPQRDEQLMKEAGFSGITLFYVGLSWRGWVTYA